MDGADLTKGSPLGGLARLRDVRSRRASSYDRSGGNDDRLHVRPGETVALMESDEPGQVNHIWVTISCREPHHLRRNVLRMYWDGEPTPSVEVPVGDFFGMGHALTRNFWSLPLQMGPEDGKGFNCWWPMPFDRARITFESGCEREETLVYYYVDYETHPRPIEGVGRFHAQFRRENLTDGVPRGQDNVDFQFGGTNPDGAGNYVLLEATGRGHYVGAVLSVDNVDPAPTWDWYGEGDDMVFVDGEPLPSIHGTGTEDYLNMSWCPTQEYSGPYHGLILPGGANWKGKISAYRFHVEDPIHFRRSLRVTIEHGHANRRSDDWSSVAFWYQAEPHGPFPPLPDVAGRLPR